MRVYLFGYLSDDFFGRVMVTPNHQTVEQLAAQLTAWGPTPEQAWEYVYEAESQPWVAGGTMLYRRSLWEKNPFQEINVGEDNAFVWSETAKRVLPSTRTFNV